MSENRNKEPKMIADLSYLRHRSSQLALSIADWQAERDEILASGFAQERSHRLRVAEQRIEELNARRWFILRQIAKAEAEDQGHPDGPYITEPKGDA